MCTFHHSLFIILILRTAFIERTIASFQPCLPAATAQGRLVPHMLYIWRSTPRTLQAWVAHLACLVGPYFPHADGEAVGVEHVSAFNASLSFSEFFHLWCYQVLHKPCSWHTLSSPIPPQACLIGGGPLLTDRRGGKVRSMRHSSTFCFHQSTHRWNKALCYEVFLMLLCQYFNILIIKWFPFFVSG